MKTLILIAVMTAGLGRAAHAGPAASQLGVSADGRGDAALMAAPLPAAPARAFAREKFFADIREEACPDALAAGEDSVICRVRSAREIFKTPVRREHKIAKLPFNGGWDAVSLGIWPDDSTDCIYVYTYELYSAAGRKLGYAQYQGYANSEMESRLDLLLKYNLKGELASVTAG